MVPVWQELTPSGADRREAEASLGRLAQRCRRLWSGLREGWESNPHGREPNAVFETGAGTNRLAFPAPGPDGARS
jgi:hypothetical protein